MDALSAMCHLCARHKTIRQSDVRLLRCVSFRRQLRCNRRLCKRTGALGVKRREASVSRHAKLAPRRLCRHKTGFVAEGDT